MLLQTVFILEESKRSMIYNNLHENFVLLHSTDNYASRLKNLS